MNNFNNKNHNNNINNNYNKTNSTYSGFDLIVVSLVSASLAALSFFYRDHYVHYLGKIWCEPVWEWYLLMPFPKKLPSISIVIFKSCV